MIMSGSTRLIAKQQQAVSTRLCSERNTSQFKIRHSEQLQTADLDAIFPANDIVSLGTLRFPNGLKPVVHKAIEYLQQEPSDDHREMYTSGEGGPVKVADEISRSPRSSKLRMPIIELIPTEHHIEPIHVQNGNVSTVRFGCSTNGTVFKDASVRSAAMTLALQLIDVYADASAAARERMNTDAAIASFKAHMSGLNELQKSQMRKHVTPDMYEALQKLYPDRKMFTEMQIKSVRDWLNAPSRSEPQLNIPPVVVHHDVRVNDRQYYVPSTVLSRSASLSKNLEAKLSEVHRKSVRLTESVAFHFATRDVESTDPALLSYAERASFAQSLQKANKALRGVSEMHDALFDEEQILEKRTLDLSEIEARHAWISKNGENIRIHAQKLLDNVRDTCTQAESRYRHVASLYASVEEINNVAQAIRKERNALPHDATDERHRLGADLKTMLETTQAELLRLQASFELLPRELRDSDEEDAVLLQIRHLKAELTSLNDESKPSQKRATPEPSAMQIDEPARKRRSISIERRSMSLDD